MPKATYILALTALAIPLLTHAQTRTAPTMAFLDIPQSTRLVGLGGLHTLSGTTSSNLIFHNPSAITDTTAGEISLNITPITNGIKYTSAAYTHHINQLGNFSIGLLCALYGNFNQTDQNANNIGQFSAHETAIYLSYARQLSPHLRLGATLKPIYSKMADQTAIAIAIDMGATLSLANGQLNTALSINNAGALIKPYTNNNNHAPLPFDIKTSISYKPQHAPFRILLTLKDITQWDLSPAHDKTLNPADNLLRHILIGLEFIPVRAFYFTIGYDHRQRRELTDTDTGGMAGFAWGAGLNIAKINIQYAHARYHAAGSLNSITIATNWRRWAKH